LEEHGVPRLEERLAPELDQVPAVLEVRVEVDGGLRVPVDRPHGGDLHALEFERLPRGSDVDSTLRDSEAAGLLDAVGRHDERAAALLRRRASSTQLAVMTHVQRPFSARTRAVFRLKWSPCPCVMNATSR